METETDLTSEIAMARRLTAMAALPDPVSGRGRRRPWPLAVFILTVTACGETGVTTPAVATSARLAGTVFRDCPDCTEMVVVPAGTFTMGSSAAEKSWAASHAENKQSRNGLATLTHFNI